MIETAPSLSVPPVAEIVRLAVAPAFLSVAVIIFGVSEPDRARNV